MLDSQPNPHRDISEASNDENRSSKRKLRSRLHGNPNVEVPQDPALAQAQRAGEAWGGKLQEERKQAENHFTIHYDKPTTNTGKITEKWPNRDSGSIISETEAINAYKSIEILGYKDVKNAIERNIHIVLLKTPKDSFELIREYEGLRERKGNLSIIEYRKLQASSKGIGSDTESYLIDLNKFLRKIEDSKTEELDIEPIKELTVTQMRKDKKEKYYENVLKKLDQLPFEGIEGISKADLQLMCLPTVDMLNKISKRIIRNVDLAPLSSLFVLGKDIRLAKSAAIYDAWIRNLEKRIDTFLQNQKNISDLAQIQENISDLAAALNNRAKYNPNTRDRVAWTRNHTGKANILWSFNKDQRVWFHHYITDSSNEEALVCREDRGTLERYQRKPEGKWDRINLGNPFGSYLQASYIKELPSLPSKPLGTVRRTAREIYKNIKLGYKSIKASYVYKKAKRRLDSRRVEGEIIYDHNTGDFVRYDQERKIYDRGRKMYDQAIKTYEEAKRHLDHKGFTRMYGRIKWELESKKTVSAYKKAKRRLDSRRVEGEIVYDHNTRNFRLYSDSLESRRLEEKTKREIASEMIITRSYHSLLHEMRRPDTETFKDVYGAANRISPNDGIMIHAGRHD